MGILFMSFYELFHPAQFFLLAHSTMLPATFLPQEGRTYKICSIGFLRFEEFSNTFSIFSSNSSFCTMQFYGYSTGWYIFGTM